jgi:formylglycine-generating enzyme required for sulfatase activity
VDVEEADGQDHLDHNGNQGDAYDTYWPGNNVTFNLTSYPNSKSYAGADTLVQVVNVSTASADLIIGVPGDLEVDETEPNNVWNDSGVIPIPAPNANPDGKVDQYTDPSDFWRFTVSKPAIVDVTLNSHNDSVNLALIVHGLGGGGPIETADTTWADEHVRSYVFVPGNHYIEVKAMRQAAYYDLTLSLEPLPDPGFVEIKSRPLLPDRIYDNTMTIPAMRFEILNHAGASQLQSLQLYTQGTYPSAIKSVELWLDNGDDIFGPGLDTLLAGPIPTGNSNKILIPNINYGIGPYTVLFVVVDTADTAGGEQTAITFQSYKDFNLSNGSIIYNNFPIQSGVAEVVDGQMPLCYVAAGDFKMGSDPANDPYYIGACDLNEETPAHQNRTGNYCISRFEITNSQFAQFMTDGGYDNQAYWTPGGWNWKNNNHVTQPKSWNDPDYKIGDAWPDYPVAGVSYHECYAFSQYLGGRVPTEPEWEKAGRGTDGRIFTYGNTYDSGAYAAYDAYPVGSFHASDSLYGVSDLEGNIFEWVGTSWEWGVYQRYANGSFQPPAFYDYFMQRGYRFLIVGDCDTDYASRLSYRDTWPRSYRWTFLGFRVAFDPPI